MKAHQIFQETSDSISDSIFQFLRDDQKEVYNATLQTLAQNRRLRPVFIQRKPVVQQLAWLSKNVRLKASNEIGEHVLQIWLMKAHQSILIEFLEGMGIEHDGEGAAEDLPDTLDKKKLKTTVDKLLADNDPEVVRIYLTVFQNQKAEGWTELTELIAETPSLQFGAATADEEAPAAEEPAVAAAAATPDPTPPAAEEPEEADEETTAAPEEEESTATTDEEE